MFWQGLKAHPTAAEAPPGPGGGKQLWDCTARTAAADLAPQVAHSLAETVPGKVGSCLGMGGVVGRDRWMGSWASDPKAYSRVVISDLFLWRCWRIQRRRSRGNYIPKKTMCPQEGSNSASHGAGGLSGPRLGPPVKGSGDCLSLRQESALKVLVPSPSACIQGPVYVVVCLLSWLSTYRILEKQANTGGSLPTRLMFGALIHTGANKPGS